MRRDVYVIGFAILIFFLSSSLPSTWAIGVTGCIPEEYSYTPYARIPFSHLILNHGIPYTIRVEGDLADYVVVEDTPGKLEGYLLLPPGLEGGVHTARLIVKESPRGQGMVLATTSVVCPIRIIVPYRGTRIALSLSPQASDGWVNASVRVKNLGETPVEGELNVSLLQGNVLITSRVFYVGALKPLDEAEFSFAQAGLLEGPYRVLAVFSTSTGKRVQKDVRVTLGGLRVSITNYTRVLSRSTYANLSFTLENEWDRQVMARLHVRLEREDWQGIWLDTGYYAIPPFSSVNVTIPYPTTDISSGDYFINYTLSYGPSAGEQLFSEEGLLPMRVMGQHRSDILFTLSIFLGLFVTLILIFFIALRRARHVRDLREERRKRARSSKNMSLRRKRSHASKK